MLPPEQEGHPHFLPSADARRAWPVADVCYSPEQAGSRLLRGDVAAQCTCLRHARSGALEIMEDKHKGIESQA